MQLLQEAERRLLVPAGLERLEPENVGDSVGLGVHVSAFDNLGRAYLPPHLKIGSRIYGVRLLVDAAAVPPYGSGNTSISHLPVEGAGNRHKSYIL